MRRKTYLYVALSYKSLFGLRQRQGFDFYQGKTPFFNGCVHTICPLQPVPLRGLTISTEQVIKWVPDGN
jgi:hypothetical protein